MNLPLTENIDTEDLDQELCGMFEQAAFLLAFPCTIEQATKGQSDWIEGRVILEGALGMAIMIRMPLAAAQATTCSVQGGDDPMAVSTADAAAMVGELANIAAGVMVGYLTDEATCSFSLPETTTLGKPLNENTDLLVRSFLADEGPVLVVLGKT